MARPAITTMLARVIALWVAGCAPAKTASPLSAPPPNPPPSRPFEGEIWMTTTAGDRGTRVFTLSGSKQRVDALAPPGVSILRDTTTGEVTILSAVSRRATIEDAVDGTDGPPVLEAQRTGVDTVAGRACDVWRITEADDVVDACVTTSIPPIHIGKRASWEARAPGFVLRVRVVDAQGIVRLDSLVVRIVEKPIPPATFEIPAGYETVHEAR